MLAWPASAISRGAQSVPEAKMLASGKMVGFVLTMDYDEVGAD